MKIKLPKDIKKAKRQLHIARLAMLRVTNVHQAEAAIDRCILLEEHIQELNRQQTSNGK